MLSSFFSEATRGCQAVPDKPRDLAFLSATLGFYGLQTVSYLVLNVKSRSTPEFFSHALHTERQVRQRVSVDPAPTEPFGTLGLLERGITEWASVERLRIELGMRLAGADACAGFSFPLRSVATETAIVGFTIKTENGALLRKNPHLFAQIESIAEYFHAQVILSNSKAREPVMSRKEIECLRLTALGKTALEAAEAMKIRERTVRFHLNSARRKLDCATTTQAVAKAISHNLIQRVI